MFASSTAQGRRPLRALLAAALFAALPLAAHADPGVVRVKDATGAHYADASGMTLYVFDKDAKGMSACTGACAAKWPPLTAAAGSSAAGDFAPIKRPDGSLQWALGGRPLYLWQGDTAPGETTGDGVGGVWHVAR